MVKKKSKKKVSILLKKVVVKKVLKEPGRLTIKIREHQPAEHQPIFFKEEFENMKKDMFLS